MRAAPYPRRPILGATIPILAGILLGQRVPCDLRACVAVLAVAAVAGLGAAGIACVSRTHRDRPGVHHGFTLCLYLVLAATAYVYSALAGPAKPVAIRQAAVAEPLTLVVEVASDPEPAVTRSRRPARRMTLKLLEVRETGGARVAVVPGAVLDVNWAGYAGYVFPAYGDRWEIGEVSAVWLRGEPAGESGRIRRRWVLSSQAQRVSTGHGYAFHRWCYGARQEAARRLGQGLDGAPEVADIGRALILGYGGSIPPSIQALGVATGTLHIFAISGQHVVIIAGFIIFGLRLLRIPLWRWGYALAPLLITYTLLSGGRASAVRACIMAVVMFLAPALRRRGDAVPALAFSALVVVLWTPSQIMDVGFQLSFVVVLGLVILCPPLWHLTARWRAGEDGDELPGEPTNGSGYGAGVRKHLLGLVVVSCAAWLASTPLSAYYFGRFTPVALIANLVVVPCSSLLVLSCTLSLVLGSVSMLFSDIFNNASLGLVAVMSWTLKGFAWIPGGNVAVARPALWMVLLWYGVVYGGGWWLGVRQRLAGAGDETPAAK